MRPLRWIWLRHSTGRTGPGVNLTELEARHNVMVLDRAARRWENDVGWMDERMDLTWGQRSMFEGPHSTFTIHHDIPSSLTFNVFKVLSF